MLETVRQSKADPGRQALTLIRTLTITSSWNDFLATGTKPYAIFRYAQEVEAAWRYICDYEKRLEIAVQEADRWKGNLQQEYGDKLIQVSLKGEKARLRQEAINGDIKDLWQDRGVQELLQALGFTHYVSNRLLEQLCQLAKQVDFDVAVANVQQALKVRTQERPGSVMQLTTEDIARAASTKVSNDMPDMQANVNLKRRKGQKREDAHPASKQQPRPLHPLFPQTGDQAERAGASVSAETEENPKASVNTMDGVDRDARQEPNCRHDHQGDDHRDDDLQDDDTSGEEAKSALKVDQVDAFQAHRRKRLKSNFADANGSEIDPRGNADPSSHQSEFVSPSRTPTYTPPGQVLPEQKGDPSFELGRGGDPSSHQSEFVTPSRTPTYTPPGQALPEQEDDPSFELGRGGAFSLDDRSPSLIKASEPNSVASTVAVGSSPFELRPPDTDSGFNSAEEPPGLSFNNVMAVVLPTEPATLCRPPPPPNTRTGAIASLRKSQWLSTTAMEMVLGFLTKKDLLMLDPSYLDATKPPAVVYQKQQLKHLALYDQVLCPLHHGNHWTIALVHLKQGWMKWYDPLRTETHYRQAESTLTAFGKFLTEHEEVDSRVQWTVHCVDEDFQQDDQVNCGVFCLIWALAKIHDGATPSSVVSCYWRRLFHALIDDEYQSFDLGGSAAASSPFSHCAHTGLVLDGIRREREALYLRQTTVDRQLLSLTQSLLLLNQAYRIAADDFKISQSQAKDLETQRGEYIRIQDTLQASSISADLLQMETLLITGRRTVEKKIKKARQVKMGYNGWKRAKQLWEAEQQQLEVQARTLQEEGATLRRLVEDFITQEKHKHTEILIEFPVSSAN
ncbi:MAG: hypothetical protein OHK93_003305 [Ramalina farinacea]|uniref:Ubiquitin-like protease family profile domain-containing protein n=1 Tax=Ramalina farinacea TaxID=258253 RepID=A0AA43TXZ8_9LECA|nr:hypothetical protein [Ramalina farinacea]